MAGKPEGYEEVADRIHRFYKTYPEGSIQTTGYEQVQVGEQIFIVCTALVYRHPEDALPGTGTAWEPFPGRTPWTHLSELMNAETSAWGRALASIGMGGKKIATADEVKQPVKESEEMSPAAQEFVAWFKKQKINPDDLKLAMTAMGIAVGNKRFNTVVKTMTDEQVASLKEKLNETA